MKTNKQLYPTIFVIIVILYMIFTNGSKTQLILSANGMEDYTSDIKARFGDKLKIELYTNEDYHKPFKIINRRIFFTSYNPVPEQTDASPCIGATGVNLCNLSERTIALSQDLVSRGGATPYHYGDMIQLVSDNPQCSGEWKVMDTMNARYRMRGDLFFNSRSDNTSCWAYIYK